MFQFTLYFAQSILHFVFVIWVCIRDSTFLHPTFNFDLRNIQVSAFDIQLFISNSRIQPTSSVECSFIFSHPTFSICPLSFRFRHQVLGICTCKFPHSAFNFSDLTFTRWSATDRDRGHNWPEPPPLNWWSRVGRETSQWSRLGRSSPLPKNQTSTTDRTKREWPSFSLDRTELPFRSKKL